MVDEVEKVDLEGVLYLIGVIPWHFKWKLFVKQFEVTNLPVVQTFVKGEEW